MILQVKICNAVVSVILWGKEFLLLPTNTDSKIGKLVGIVICFNYKKPMAPVVEAFKQYESMSILIYL